MSSDLFFEGKKFISSRRAADLCAYTQDYVGQLIRSGKLEAKMVGRNWFVAEDSILAYKRLADESSRTLFQEEKKTISASREVEVPAPFVEPAPVNHPVAAASEVKEVVVIPSEPLQTYVGLTYVSDERSSLPELKKPSSAARPVIEKLEVPEPVSIPSPFIYEEATVPSREVVGGEFAKKAVAAALSLSLVLGSYAVTDVERAQSVLSSTEAVGERMSLAVTDTFMRLGASAGLVKDAYLAAVQNAGVYTVEGVTAFVSASRDIASLYGRTLNGVGRASSDVTDVLASVSLPETARAIATQIRIEGVGSASLAAVSTTGVSLVSGLESVAVGVYETINPLFTRTGSFLAGLFAPKESVLVMDVPQQVAPAPSAPRGQTVAVAPSQPAVTASVTGPISQVNNTYYQTTGLGEAEARALVQGAVAGLESEIERVRVEAARANENARNATDRGSRAELDRITIRRSEIRDSRMSDSTIADSRIENSTLVNSNLTGTTTAGFLSADTIVANTISFSTSTVENSSMTNATSTNLFATTFSADRLQVAGSTGVTITSGGLVGIGTSTPDAQFAISQITNGLPMLSARRVTDVAPSGDFISYRSADGETVLFRVDNSGNLLAGGIITTGSYTVTSTSSPQFRVQYDSSAEMTTMVASSGAAMVAVNGSNPSISFVPQTNGTSTFAVTDAALAPILSVNTIDKSVTITNLVASTGVIAGLSSTNSTSTNATSTNLFSTNFVAVNSIVDNATSTNLSAASVAAGDIVAAGSLAVSGQTTLGGVTIVNSTTTNATTTNFATDNLFSTVGRIITGTVDTLTSVAANITTLVADSLTTTQIVATNSTTTNATSTNLYASNLSTAGLNVSGDTTLNTDLSGLAWLSNGLVGTTSTSSLGFGASFFQQDGNSFGSTATFGTNDGQSVALETSGTPRLTVTAAGNVGIGSTTPLSNLSVSGTAGQTANLFTVASSSGNRILNVAPSGDVNFGTVATVVNSLGNGYLSVGGQGVLSSNFFSTNAAVNVSAGTNQNLTLSGGQIVMRSNNNVVAAQIAVDGRFAVGTSTPVARLSVQAPFGSSTPLFDISTTTSAAFATSSVFRVNGDGSVGVGTSTASARLTVVGTSGSNIFDVISSVGSNLFSIDNGTGNVSFNGAGGEARVGGGSGARLSVSSLTSSKVSASISGVSGQTADLLQVNKTSVSAGGDAFVVNASGNVGIGTTSPSANLSVMSSGSGNAFAVATTSGQSALSVSSAGVTTINGLLNVNATNAAGQDTVIVRPLPGQTNARIYAQNSTGSVGGYFGTDSANSRMVFSTAQNMVIGANAFTFDANGLATMTFTNAQRVGIGSTSPQSLVGIQGQPGTLSPFVVASSTGVPMLTVNPNGSVASLGTTTALNFVSTSLVGTSSIVGALNVGGSSNTSAKLFTSGAIQFINGTDPGLYGALWSVNSGDFAVNMAGPQLSFYTGGNMARQERIRINGSGNVGIGTTTPSSKLDVGGDVANNQITVRRGGSNPSNVSLQAFTSFPSIGYGGLFDILTFNGLNSTTEYMRLINGNLAIGTTTGSARLGVEGDGYFSGNITAANITATGTVAISGNASFTNASTTNLTVSGNANFASGIWGSSGSVGVGTTTPTQLFSIASSTSNVFTVNVNGQVTTKSNPSSNFRFFQTTDDNNTIIYSLSRSNGAGGTGNDVTMRAFEDIHFATGNSDSAVVSVKQGGFVGIGTTSPVSKLVVSGNNSSIAQIDVTSTDTGVNSRFYSGNIGSPVNANGGLFGTQTNHGFYLMSNNLVRMAVDAGGNIGVGTTSPVAKLSVTGAGTGTGQAFVVTDSSNVQRLSVLDNGNVAIGVGSPTSKLDIRGGSLRVRAQAAGAHYFDITSADSVGTTLSDNYGYIALSTNTGGGVPIERFRVTGTGNVGIGTTSPVSPLAVVGKGTFGDSAAITPQLEVIGGSLGAGIIRLSRPSNGAIFDWALTGGGLAFNDVAGAGGATVVNIFGNSGTNELYVGQSAKTAADSRPSLISGTTFGSTAGSDVSAQNLTLRSGLGTGAGVPGDLIFQTGTALSSGNTTQSGSSRLVIKGTTGNVGIGTTTPSNGLEVAGSGYFAGNLTAANITATGTLSVSGNTSFANASTTNLTVSGDASFASGVWNSSGNLGIGTTTPVSKLTINTSSSNLPTFTEELVIVDNAASPGSAQATLVSGGAGTSRWSFGTQFGSNVGGLEYVHNVNRVDIRGNSSVRMSIDSSGNVGIGTTTPINKFSVVGSSATSLSTNTYQQGISDGTRSLSFGVTGVSTEIQSSGSVPLYINPAGTNNTVFNLSGGNVGIGTSTPSNLLSVYGTSGSGSLSNGISIQNNSTNGFASLTFERNRVGGLAAGAAIRLQSEATGTQSRLEFVTNTSNNFVGSATSSSRAAMRLVSSGSGDSGAYLEVARFLGASSADGTDTLAPQIRFTSVDSTGNNEVHYGRIGALVTSSTTGATTGDLQFFSRPTSGLTERMRITGDGNVGIGTTSPQQALTVFRSGGDSYAQFVSNTTGSLLTDGFQVGVGTAGEAFLNNREATSMLFRTSGVTRATIDSSGNVGIGTTTPIARLEVSASGSYLADTTNAGFTISNAGVPTERLHIGVDSSVGSNGSAYIQSIRSGSAYTNILLNPSGGNVGIGSTTPSSRLTVKSNGDNFGVIVDASSSNTRLAGILQENSTSASFRLYNAGTETIRFTSQTGISSYVNNGGNFGIGTTSPAAPLTVFSTAANSASGQEVLRLGAGLSGGTPGSGPAIVFANNSGTVENFKIRSGADVSGSGRGNLIFSGGTASASTLSDFMTLAYTGNLGIGTTSPAAKLSVVGETLSSWFTATSTTATSSIAGSFDVGNGAIRYNYGTGLTSIDNIQLGNMNFEADSGVVTWIDMPVTAASAAGTKQSYTAGINGNPLLTVYSESDGLGGIQNSGVGIGTSTPLARLDVWGNFRVSTSTSAASPLVFANTASGMFGIGTSSPTAQLHTTGTVRFSNFGSGTLTTDASGNVSVSSDERLKDMQGRFARGLEDLKKINPILYKWNATSGLDTVELYAGFSAQNVETAIPEAIGVNPNGFLSLNDRPILAASVNAIKELALSVASTTERMASMESRVRSLELTLATAGVPGFVTASTSASSTIETVSGWLASLGASIENAVARFATVIADAVTTKKMTVGDTSNLAASGITIFDRSTGQPVCMFIEGGVMKSEPGECGAQSQPVQPEPVQPEPQPTQPETAPSEPTSSEPSGDTASSTPEVIDSGSTGSTTPEVVPEPTPTIAPETTPEPEAVTPEPEPEQAPEAPETPPEAASEPEPTPTPSE